MVVHEDGTMHKVVCNKQQFPRELKQVDFCVVGGGMAGVCVAIAGACRGLKTILIQDRAVLGERFFRDSDVDLRCSRSR